MDTYSTTRVVFFSPTHTSARIARAVAEGIGMGRRIETDLTLDLSDTPIPVKNELTVIAAPVYGGRVAPVALQRIRRLQAENSPAILAESFFIKGHSPYKVVQAGKPSCPVCNEHCFVCGECIDVCPTRAISVSADGSRIETDINRCIRCCACVKVCPNQARIYDNPFAAILHEKCSTRREPELFL